MIEFASPDDMGQVRLWLAYVVAQVSYASLENIPRSAWRIGVRVNREHVTLVVDWTDPDAVDRQDWADLVSEFEELVGPDVIVDDEAHVSEPGQAPFWPDVEPTYIHRDAYAKHEYGPLE